MSGGSTGVVLVGPLFLWVEGEVVRGGIGMGVG